MGSKCEQTFEVGLLLLEILLNLVCGGQLHPSHGHLLSPLAFFPALPFLASLGQPLTDGYVFLVKGFLCLVQFGPPLLGELDPELVDFDTQVS